MLYFRLCFKFDSFYARLLNIEDYSKINVHLNALIQHIFKSKMIFSKSVLMSICLSHGQFYAKKMFSQKQISRMDKKYPIKVFLWFQIPSFWGEENYLNTLRFLVFLKFRCLIAKSETGTEFFLFLTPLLALGLP